MSTSPWRGTPRRSTWWLTAPRHASTARWKTVGHSGGTLDGCSLSIAVALPRPRHQTVRARGLDVTYQADGHTYVAHTDLEIAIRKK